ncbi:unnamed protein product [Strongylus vulgaris]|uniref:Uncharacterized protein n=1 Tax=Strongylus vulgaris TaxID=40348 RepID=A0A3P7KA12_STRVU|nr:unnamed protein product [Strongylus vulgaris]
MHRNNGEVIVKDKEWGKSYDENNVIDGDRQVAYGHNGAERQTSAIVHVTQRLAIYPSATGGPKELATEFSRNVVLQSLNNAPHWDHHTTEILATVGFRLPSHEGIHHRL